MDAQRFEAVDTHLDELFGGEDAALAAAQARADAAGLPPISVSSNLGRFLQVLTLARGATSVLEIGTLAGYSTIWLARGLPPDGRLVTCELDQHHAEVARTNLDAAGVGAQVDIRVGPARDSLAALEAEATDPFDLVFIDADKESYVDYLHAAIRLGAPGTLIVADNVVRGGVIADGPSDDDRVTGIQRFNTEVARHPALAAASVIQVVGSKGHDGLALAVIATPR